MYRKPLVVQDDHMLFLFESADQEGEVGELIGEFADLLKAPESVHTYRISPFSLWSAAAKGKSADEIIAVLKTHSQNLVSKTLETTICERIVEFGTLKLIRGDGFLKLECNHPKTIDTVLANDKILKLGPIKIDEVTLRFPLNARTKLKEHLFEIDLFAIDQCNVFGEPLHIRMQNRTKEGSALQLRDYQNEAIEKYLTYGDAAGGGVIMMPPTSGKTLVGLKIMEQVKLCTLILVDNDESALKWIDELQDKTDLDKQSIGFFKGDSSVIKPVTIATYKNLSSNPGNLEQLKSLNWGLVIYDDAHRLPAKTYCLTTDIPSQKKLGLAATLARSDDKGHLVFIWIGPKLFEVSSRVLERLGYVAPVSCMELRVPLGDAEYEKYHLALQSNDEPDYTRVATCNSDKMIALETILHDHQFERNILIVSYSPEPAERISDRFQFRRIYSTTQEDLRRIVDQFNLGEIKHLVSGSVIEQVPITEIDLLIAVSYHKGSVREEYLRIGKLMHPISDGKRRVLVSLVSENTVEQGHYTRRRRSMINLGYRYKIYDFEDLLKGRLEI